MLVRGLNDSSAALEEIAETMQRIQPDEVHINLPTRPPAETWVNPPEETSLRNAVNLFGSIAKVVQPTEGILDLECTGEVTDAILSIIDRHPMIER